MLSMRGRGGVRERERKGGNWFPPPPPVVYTRVKRTFRDVRLRRIK